MRPQKPPSGWPVRDVATALDFEIDDAALAAIETWLDVLAQWNAKMDLTAAKDARALAWLMLADAIMLAKTIASSAATVVDVGTGAGAPGLALTILRRDLRVILCEPLGKRAAFLRTAVGVLAAPPYDLKNVSIDPKRGEDLEKHAVDIAISRATLTPEIWLALGASLVRAGGEVFVMLAQEDPPSLAGWIAIDTFTYDDAATGAKKKLVRYAVSP